MKQYTAKSGIAVTIAWFAMMAFSTLSGQEDNITLLFLLFTLLGLFAASVDNTKSQAISSSMVETILTILFIVTLFIIGFNPEIIGWR